MIRKLFLVTIFGSMGLLVACGSSGESTEASPTTRTGDPITSQTGSEIGPDGQILDEADPEIALSAAIEAISGFDVTSVSFRGDDVTVKYDQIVNEPSELLLLRWLDFASIAATFFDEPSGDIVLVPQVENSDIATVRLRAIDVVDYINGKRPLEDVLASIEIR